MLPIPTALLLALLALPSPPAPPSASQGQGTPAAGERADPLARVAVLGASATAGFNLASELGEPVGMGDFVALALGRESVFDRSDAFLFTDPRGRVAPHLAATREHAPTLTLAVDLPFWFVHGRVPEERRLEELEWLLARLAEWPGELLLGTVPVLDDAVSELMVPRVLRAGEATVARANERLADWVAERERAHLVPTAALFADLREGEAPAVRGERVHPDDVELLLQADGLHPTVLGTALLALVVLDHADRALGGVLADRVRFDLDALVDGVGAR